MLIKITKKEIFIIYFFINDFYKWFNLMREKERKKERKKDMKQNNPIFQVLSLVDQQLLEICRIARKM